MDGWCEDTPVLFYPIPCYWGANDAQLVATAKKKKKFYVQNTPYINTDTTSLVLMQ